MDIEQIRELIQLMVDNDLSEVDISDGKSSISLKRGPGDQPVMAVQPAAPAAVAVPAAPAAAAAAAPEVPDDLIEIHSPMVGTFYAAPSPDSEPFVQVGASVSDETAVCIVEAMKVMNEIKAECAGTIAQVCVRNAQPVEFGQVLFRVKPAAP